MRQGFAPGGEESQSSISTRTGTEGDDAFPRCFARFVSLSTRSG